MANPPRIEVYRRKDKKFAWRAKAANGRIVATDGGQGYSTWLGARKGLFALAKAINSGEIFETLR